MFVRAVGQLRTAGEVFRQGSSRLPMMLENLFLVVHPAKIRKRTLAFRHTYYLGTAAASVWLVLIGTGLLMMFHVRPAVPEIYRDLKDLQFTVEYGGLIRNLHHWAASAMVLLVFLHMLRVFFHRAYVAPRRETWFIGVGLFVLTFLSAHSGYLLPWDQKAYWGISIAATMASQVPLIGDQFRFLLLGGNSIGPNAVLHFYVLHCLLIPAATALLVAAHLWRIRKTGVQGPGVASGADTPQTSQPSSDEQQEEQVDAFPHLLLREVMVFQWVVIVLVALALTGDPPLEELANPLETPDPVKAPWYFAGLQELLHYFPPVVAGVIAPALVIGLLIAVPFVRVSRRTGSPLGLPKTAVAPCVAVLSLAVTALLAAVHAWVVLIPTLTIEALALCGLRLPPHAGGIRGWLGRRSPLDWIVLWLVTVAVVITLTGTFFRGPGWVLVWPSGALQ